MVCTKVFLIGKRREDNFLFCHLFDCMICDMFIMIIYIIHGLGVYIIIGFIFFLSLFFSTVVS